MMMLSTETELSKTSAGVHRFLDLHLRFVFQIDIARHRDLAKGSFPDSSPSKKKKTQKSKHLQTVIPNVLQELATDTDLSKTSAGVHRRLCYPMCYAFAGDLCRSPLTMMISSTETELSKTSSRISLAQC